MKQQNDSGGSAPETQTKKPNCLSEKAWKFLVFRGAHTPKLFVKNYDRLVIGWKGYPSELSEILLWAQDELIRVATEERIARDAKAMAEAREIPDVEVDTEGGE